MESESESESEGAEAALPEEHIALLVKVVVVSYSALLMLSNPGLTPTSESEPELQSGSEGDEAALLREQAGGEQRQEVNAAARPQEKEEPCQAIESPLRHLSLPDFDLTATSGSELKSEATEAGLSEEQVAGECRR